VSRRDDFDLAPGEIYLNGAYCTPLPRTARARVAEAYALNAEPYRLVPDVFFEYTEAVRESVARILGAAPEDVGVTNSTSFGAFLLARSIRWRAGGRILLGPDEFPSNVYPWLALSEEGMQVEIIGRHGHALTVEELEKEIAKGGVAALSVAAVHYLTGDLHPLGEFGRLLHARGAYLFTDATQAVGAVAYDWPALEIDAILTSGYKWLFGPYGTGAIRVARALLEDLRNVNGNWWAIEDARDFPRVLEVRGFPMHARRLDSGETASFLNLGAWRAGLEYHLGVGTAALEAHHRALQDALVEKTSGRGLTALTRLDAKHRSPMLYFELDAALAEALQTELVARKIAVSLRSGRLRVSPGWWNDEADLDAFAAALQQVFAP
jgi:selenocysteine lyase/cysteine desulfurase